MKWLQIDAALIGSLHPELVHGFMGLRDIQLIVVLAAHFIFSLSVFGHGLTKDRWRMNDRWRSNKGGRK